MATRYSGNVTMRIQYMDHDGQYHISVSWPGDRRRVIVGHPAHLTMAVDSPEAYDNAARAALAFVLDEIEGPKPDRGSIFVHYNNDGIAIARQRDPLAGTGRPGPMPQYRGLGGPALLVDPPLVSRGGREITAEELSETIGVPVNAAREILTRIERGQRNGDDAPRLLKMIEGILAPYDASRIPTFGVEAIIDPRRSFRGPHGQVVAYYLNTGDPYTSHLMFDADFNQYKLAAWADLLEEHERENGPIPG